jgi:hypothetical protein
MDKLSERRLVENEVIFREANKSVQEFAEQINDGDRKVPFFCECSNAFCRDKILLSAKMYGKQHNDERHFIVLPGHEMSELERVIKKDKRFNIIEKMTEIPSPEEVDSALHPI